jgi:signal-transduction protein with cAMP-binding, CBS, and nucleotidyltransferase domain
VPHPADLCLPSQLLEPSSVATIIRIRLAVMRVHELLDVRPSLIDIDATVGDVARRMHRDAVDAVAVIDPTGAPVGMVTGSDLITLVATTVAREPTKADEPKQTVEPTQP